MKTLTANKSETDKKPIKKLGEFATAAEAAKAKNAEFMKSLEKVDLSFLKK